MAANLAQYRLYPWLRKGMANHITQASSSGTGERAKVPVSIKLNTKPEPITKEFPILGPGDIVGFDQRLIIRTEPQANHHTFAPNYLAFIEFYDEDLPWRYSPLSNPDTNKSLRPWIFLIVLKDDEFKMLEQKTPFPLIEILDSNLSKTLDSFREEESKFWAHVQCTDQDPPTQDLEQVPPPKHPDRTISRIISPRKLDPNTPYTGFLLPAFDSGIRAGGVNPGTDSPEGKIPATTYPVYYQWRFHTSNAVDFEYLVNLLEPRTMPFEIGRRFVDFSKPGFIKADVDTSALKELMIEGPLVAPARAGSSVPVQPNAEAFSQELERLAKMNSIKVDHENDPVLSIPFYGAKHVINDPTDETEIGTDYASSKVQWLYDLNWKNPGNRPSAGLGTRIIRRDQDRYMDRAWDQLESIVAANKSINLAEVMIRLSERWQEQHVKPLGQSIQYAQLVEPLLRTYRSFRELRANPCSAKAILSRSLRRQLAPGAVLGRNVARFGESASHEVLSSLLKGRENHPFTHQLGKREDVEGATYIVDFREFLNEDKKLTDEYKLADFLPNTKPECTPINTEFLQEPLNVDGRYRYLLDASFDGLTDYLYQDLLRLKPAMAYPQFDDPMFEKLRELGTDYLIANLDKVPHNTISVLESNQVFIESFMVGLNYEMGKELRWREYPTDERGSYFRQFWDTAGLVDYDQAGDKAAEESEKYKDISAIHTWEGITGRNALGEHRPPAPDLKEEPSQSGVNEDNPGDDKPIENDVVLIIRGDLIRAFPNVTVYVVKAINGENGVNNLVMSDNPEDIHYPIFKAEVQPDVKFLGFSLKVSDIKGTGQGSNLGYFFVLKEVPGELRLGLDIAPEKEGVEPETWDDLSWVDIDKLENGVFTNLSKPKGALSKDWPENSAERAKIFYQKPVMAVIHGTEMLDKITTTP